MRRWKRRFCDRLDCGEVRECTDQIQRRHLQHTLLKNRIRALYLSKELVEAELLRMGGQLSAASCEEAGKCETPDSCVILGEGSFMEELKSAVPPIVSIISKCEKAQSKYEKRDGAVSAVRKR